MDPQQELFTELLLRLKALEYDVYDTFLPPEARRILHLSGRQPADGYSDQKCVVGNVYQTIHVWHNNPRQRGTVSGILLDIKEICYRLEHTANFAWMVQNMNQRILPDNTTKTPLLHGLLEVEFKFS